jgi:hypothetical protein
MSTERSAHIEYLLAPGEDQDAAKRISEQYALHQAAAGAQLTDVMGWYFPVFLRDGRQPEGTGIYPTKQMAALAVRPRDRDCCYVALGPAGMPPHDALQFLRFFRNAALKGLPIADPDYARQHRPDPKRFNS